MELPGTPDIVVRIPLGPHFESFHTRFRFGGRSITEHVRYFHHCAGLELRRLGWLSVETYRVDLKYAVLLEPEADGTAYNVIVPALPEAHTWGETVDEALTMAREVIELCVEERRSRGEEIPPSDAETARLEAVAITLPAA